MRVVFCFSANSLLDVLLYMKVDADKKTAICAPILASSWGHINHLITYVYAYGRFSSQEDIAH